MENKKSIGLTKPKNTIERSEFMKQVGISVGAIILMNCVQGCSDSEIPDPNPIDNTGKVDITIDLTSSDYSSLKSKGSYAYIKSKGIIVAHTNADTFIAVASTCTHEGTTINFRASSTDFSCPNHGATFSSTGSVTKGPAANPLKKYSVSADLTNNKLRIFE
jgi:cytochrome b6-f complex iron-sulfur subunit